MADSNSGLDFEALKRDWLEQERRREKEELAKAEDHIEKFKKHCRRFGISLNTSNFSAPATTGVIATYPNLVEVLLPDLHVDQRDQLVPLAQLCMNFSAMPEMGAFVADGYALLAHRFFRRGHAECNHFPHSFVEKFIRPWNQDISASIALDMNRVFVGPKPLLYMEADFWFGPPFRGQIEDISDGSTFLVPPADLSEHHISFFFQDNRLLSVNWSTKPELRTFQTRAFRTERVELLFEEEVYRPVPYLHAEFDISAKVFRHFDGALHLYTPEEYAIAARGNFSNRTIDRLKPRALKLFKLNGAIQLDVWSEFAGEFLSGNPLIVEYLTGALPNQIATAIDRIREHRERNDSTAR